MSKAFINDENLTDIADAIRATLDESRQYLPSEMAAAIQSVPIMAQLNRKKYFQSVPAGAASGYATIEQIEGNTVVWNQLVDTSDTSCTVPNGHKYYSIIGGTKSISTSDGTSFAVTGGTDVVIDLTRIFGAGNEPTTVADFEAWLAQNIGTLPYYDYNAGELLSVKMSGMQTEDSSQQTLDTIALDVTTVTGINTATNVRETIFPNGMKKADRAGTVKDILDLLSDTATKKTKKLVLDGTENWATVPSSGGVTLVGVHRISSRTPTDIMDMVGDSISLCSHYSVTPIRAGIAASLTDRQFGWNTSYYLHIKDERFLDATTFKAYLASQYAAGTPVTLVYPINPITYTDLQDGNGNPLNPRYKVEQGGTEQVLPVNTSTPTTVAPTLSTIYKKNN